MSLRKKESWTRITNIPIQCEPPGAMERQRQSEVLQRITQERDALQTCVKGLETRHKELLLNMEKERAEKARVEETRKRVEDAQRSVVLEVEEQVRERTHTTEEALFSLFGSLLRVSLSVSSGRRTAPSTEALEEVLGRCPLDSLTESEFNDLLDAFAERYEALLEEGQEGQNKLKLQAALQAAFPADSMDLANFSQACAKGGIDLAGCEADVFRLFGKERISRADLKGLLGELQKCPVRPQYQFARGRYPVWLGSTSVAQQY